jgi:hypothetical protein
MTEAREGITSLISRAVLLKEMFFNVRQCAPSEIKRSATHSEERKKGNQQPPKSLQKFGSVVFAYGMKCKT